MNTLNQKITAAVMLATVFISAKVVMVLAEAPNEVTIAVQSLIDNAKAGKFIVDLPGGDVPINDGLVIPFQAGWVIDGIGASELNAYEDALAGPSSRLVASGADRVAMDLLTINSAETKISDVSLFGFTEAEMQASAPRAKCGILMTKPGEGLATGGTLLDNVYIIGFVDGIQAAVGELENNCERGSFNKVRFHYCDAGFSTMSQQAMGWGLSNCEWYDCVDCIQVEAGGKIVVTNAFVHHPADAGPDEYTFLRMSPRDYETSIGPNNGMFYIAGLYADAIASDFKMLVMEPEDDNNVRVPYYCTTTFVGFHIALADYTEPSVNVAGWSSTTLRDGYGLQTNWVAWDNEPSGVSKTISRVHIDNCQIWGASTGIDVISKATSRGECRVIVSNCYDEFGAPIADYDALVIGDLP